MSEREYTDPNTYFEWPDDARQQVPGGYDGTYTVPEWKTGAIPRGVQVGPMATQFAVEIVQ